MKKIQLLFFLIKAKWYNNVPNLRQPRRSWLLFIIYLILINREWHSIGSYILYISNQGNMGSAYFASKIWTWRRLKSSNFIRKLSTFWNIKSCLVSVLVDATLFIAMWPPVLKSTISWLEIYRTLKGLSYLEDPFILFWRVNPVISSDDDVQKYE